MLVDDDRTILKLLQQLLELDGFEVTTVIRGADALPMARKVQPHVALVDFHLEDMDGLDVVKALREDTQLGQIPIVVASGMNVEEEVMRAGATRFLVKPFDPDELSAVFQQLLAT
jgi:CheY-like chemotaxis protein